MCHDLYNPGKQSEATPDTFVQKTVSTAPDKPDHAGSAGVAPTEPERAQKREVVQALYTSPQPWQGHRTKYRIRANCQTKEVELNCLTSQPLKAELVF